LHSIRECNRIAVNPGNPPVFKPVNPGLCAGKNPGLNNSGIVLHRKACRNMKQSKCGKKSETIKYNNTINNALIVFYAESLAY